MVMAEGQVTLFVSMYRHWFCSQLAVSFFSLAMPHPPPPGGACAMALWDHAGNMQSAWIHERSLQSSLLYSQVLTIPNFC